MQKEMDLALQQQKQEMEQKIQQQLHGQMLIVQQMIQQNTSQGRVTPSAHSGLKSSIGSRKSLASPKVK